MEMTNNEPKELRYAVRDEIDWNKVCLAKCHPATSDCADFDNTIDVFLRIMNIMKEIFSCSIVIFIHYSRFVAAITLAACTRRARATIEAIS